MRSVFVHLKNTEKRHVTDLLNTSYQLGNSDPEQWLELNGDDPVLYIEFYSDYEEYEPGEWNCLVDRLGSIPSVSVVADVSGRHRGRIEALKFVNNLLLQFEGVSQDDSDGIWSLKEIEEEKEYEGKKFFPY